jgi:hypothetical protein
MGNKHKSNLQILRRAIEQLETVQNTNQTADKTIHGGDLYVVEPVKKVKRPVGRPAKALINTEKLLT